MVMSSPVNFSRTLSEYRLTAPGGTRICGKLPSVQVVLTIFGAFVASWLVLVGALLLVRPRGVDLAEAKRFVPDLVALVRDLRRDPAVKGVKLRLGLLLGYLALPFDLVPDFIPVLGYADDVIVVAVVLRAVVRVAGADAIDRHWRGTDVGRTLLRSLAGA
jgi:uncharacterized membrane protein YkvA (DUF1232 family)